MEYISVKEAAEDCGLNSRMVIYHCTNGRIEGAQKIVNVWVVPRNATRPKDRRKGNGCKPSANK